MGPIRAGELNRFASNGVSPGDVIITFNYDVSLELALRKAGKWEIHNGYGFRILDDPKTSPVRVLKLHGSTSWLDVVIQGAHAGFQKSDKSREGYGLRPQILPQHFELFGYGDGVRDPSFIGGAGLRDGSMILPTREKHFTIREEFWDRLWNQAQDALRTAREIVVVGYSMPRSDDRARSLILDHGSKKASVFCCCRGDNKRLVQEFQSRGFGHTTELSDFEAWLESC